MANNNKTDELFNNLADGSIKILSETLAEKDKIINYWRNKAYILANKNGLCYQHETRESESNNSPRGQPLKNNLKFN